MHFTVLTTVCVEKSDAKPYADVLKQIKELESKEKLSIMEDIALKRLRGFISLFGVDVYNAIDKKMEPFGEQFEGELDFNVMMPEDEFTTRKIDAVRGARGKLYSVNAAARKKIYIRDGKICSYDDATEQYVEIDRTKKMTIVQCTPAELYPNIAAYAKDVGEEYKPGEGIGFYCNNNAFYDWYSIGGRWSQQFLVKKDCAESSVGDCGEGEILAPEGYKWAAAARKKDICWDAMRQWRYSRGVESYRKYASAFVLGIVPDDCYGRLESNGISSFGDMLYIKDETLDEYLIRQQATLDDLPTSHLFYALLDHDDFYEEKSADERVWSKKIWDFISECDDDEVLVSLDCHI